MGDVLSQRLAEAEELLKELRSWSATEIGELPEFYREKAREYRSKYLQDGEE